MKWLLKRVTRIWLSRDKEGQAHLCVSIPILTGAEGRKLGFLLKEIIKDEVGGEPEVQLQGFENEVTDGTID